MVSMARWYRFGVLLFLIPILSGAGTPIPPRTLAEKPGFCPLPDTDDNRRPNSLQRCDSGGTGARTCESNEGITVMGVHDGCGITCLEGYYACCTRGNLFTNPSCTCIKTPTYPYSPAFRPSRRSEG
jgi:hypothetical protein